MFRTKITSLLTVALTLLAGSTVKAQPKLGPLFSDNMVVQQSSDAPIWGMARPGKKVTVVTSWNGERLQTRADEHGRWQVVMHTPAAGGPYDITVSDGKSVVLHNVMSGEVWICSGQSNMEYPIKGWTEVLNAQQEMASMAAYPDVRMLQIHKVSALTPQDTLVANSESWLIAGDERGYDFSAVAFFFARTLNEKLHVPVAVIDATWGGSNIESWISAETLSQVPYLRHGIENLAESTDHDRNKWTGLFNGMIHPLMPMAMRGVLWYQGEQNEHRGHEYRDLFSLLVRDWRLHWQQEPFPFYFVQLANFHERYAEPVEAEWAELRESQDLGLHIENTGMAVITDVGLGHDVHYPNKQEVARRLSLIALAKTYGQNVEYQGPRMTDYEFRGNKVAIMFANADGGLVQKGDTLRGFTVAGPDHIWHNADAKIEGSTVIVSSVEVRMPVAVRYAWQDNPEICLYNQAGLPAASFRTDDWQGLSYGKNRLNSDY